MLSIWWKILVWIFGNFQWWMEQDSLEFPEKGKTLWAIPKVLGISVPFDFLLQISGIFGWMVHLSDIHNCFQICGNSKTTCPMSKNSKFFQVELKCPGWNTQGLDIEQTASQSHFNKEALDYHCTRKETSSYTSTNNLIYFI